MKSNNLMPVVNDIDNMNFVKVTHENIESEHICCAIANNKDVQVMLKKSWLKARLDEGLYS